MKLCKIGFFVIAIASGVSASASEINSKNLNVNELERAANPITAITTKYGSHDDLTQVYVYNKNGLVAYCQDMLSGSQRVPAFLELAKLSMVMKYNAYTTLNEDCNLRIESL